ncbi:MAG: class I SAM-dependent methyltransferase [Actinomycetota bacterium]|nr:class I SAM-dependent methyltransferase [Actinomycetota bacterium]
MDSQGWDDRYANADLVWSAEPNIFVAEIAGGLPPGRALDLACGEGRNAIWLAKHGWSVTGVDFSAVGIDKGRRLAAAAGVEVAWEQHDLVTWEPAAHTFDLVVTAYLHLVAPDMARVLAHAAGALAGGGYLLVVGHALANLHDGHGGPQEPAVLYDPDDLAGWLTAAGLSIERAEHVTRDIGTPEEPRRAIDALVLAKRLP